MIKVTLYFNCFSFNFFFHLYHLRDPYTSECYMIPYLSVFTVIADCKNVLLQLYLIDRLHKSSLQNFIKPVGML